MVALRKGKYQSVEEAVEATVENYVAGLIHWSSTKNLTLGIHPIRPPSFRSPEEERDRILLFNNRLKRTIANLRNQSIYFLDILEGLMEENGFLKEKYNSGDEVHLNSNYLPLLAHFLGISRTMSMTVDTIY